MGSKYVTHESPLRDFLFEVMARGANLSSPKLSDDIYSACMYILENYLINKNNIIHLDFDIKKGKFDGHHKVVACNIVTALWFMGIMPTDCDEVLKKNELEYDNKIYKFNQKTKVLTHKTTV